MNRKGYMLVELILASALAFGLAFFVLNLTIRLKNKNDDMLVETQTLTDKAIISNKLMDMLNNDENFDCKKLVVDRNKNKIIYDDKLIDIVNEYTTIAPKSEYCTNTSDRIAINIPLDVKQMPNKDFDVNVYYVKPSGSFENEVIYDANGGFLGETVKLNPQPGFFYDTPNCRTTTLYTNIDVPNKGNSFTLNSNTDDVSASSNYNNENMHDNVCYVYTSQNLRGNSGWDRNYQLVVQFNGMAVGTNASQKFNVDLFNALKQLDEYDKVALPEINPIVYSDFQTINWIIDKEKFSQTNLDTNHSINLRFFYNLSQTQSTSDFVYDVKIEDVTVYMCRANDCEFTKTEKVKYGENYPQLIPTRTGYTFDGWWTSRVGGQKVADASMSTTLEQITPHRLYAHWK